MTTINQLSAVDAVISSDQMPIYSSTNGDARKTSVATLGAYLSTQVTSINTMITQYAAPSTAGFTIALNNANNSVWLIITPPSTIASGTIVFPEVNNAIDGQEIVINTTQTLTSLTFNANGATKVGEPASLSIGGFVRFRFNGVLKIWYRIG